LGSDGCARRRRSRAVDHATAVGISHGDARADVDTALHPGLQLPDGSADGNAGRDAETDAHAGADVLPYVHAGPDAQLVAARFRDADAFSIAYSDPFADTGARGFDEPRARGARAVRVGCDARIRELDLAPLPQLAHV
jgi:hypothetical protein